MNAHEAPFVGRLKRMGAKMSNAQGGWNYEAERYIKYWLEVASNTGD